MLILYPWRCRNATNSPPTCGFSPTPTFAEPPAFDAVLDFLAVALKRQSNRIAGIEMHT